MVDNEIDKKKDTSEVTKKTNKENANILLKTSIYPLPK